jgi:histidine triad (HIT) family protein
MPAAPDPADIPARLADAADGLLYISEGEAPFQPVRIPGPAASAEEALRAFLKLPDGAAIETRTLERFFAHLTDRADPNDPAAQALVPRYRQLIETLRQLLPDIAVYRVGTAEIACYLIGRADDGSFPGLQTTAYES